LELYLDHAGVHVGPHEDQISPIGLHRRPHQVDDPLQFAQAVGTFGITQGSLGV